MARVPPTHTLCLITSVVTTKKDGRVITERQCGDFSCVVEEDVFFHRHFSFSFVRRVTVSYEEDVSFCEGRLVGSLNLYV